MPETKDNRGFAMLTVVLAMIVGLVSCDTRGPHLEAGEMADDEVYGNSGDSEVSGMIGHGN